MFYCSIYLSDTYTILVSNQLIKSPKQKLFSVSTTPFDAKISYSKLIYQHKKNQ